jgi:hypothetical protein
MQSGGRQISRKATHNLAFNKNKEMGALPMSFRMGRIGQKEDCTHERKQKKTIIPLCFSVSSVAKKTKRTHFSQSVIIRPILSLLIMFYLYSRCFFVDNIQNNWELKTLY